MSGRGAVPLRVPLHAIALTATLAAGAHAHGASTRVLPTSALSSLAATARWASGVVRYSSQYSNDNWAATQALGYPNTLPRYGDAKTAWASQTQDGQREYLELSFDDPEPANYLVVVETFNVGAIDSVYTWNPNTSDYDLVWNGIASAGPNEARLWVVVFPPTSYPVSRVRLAVNSPAVHGWNEIDAVALGHDGVLTGEWASTAVASSQYGSVYYSAMQATGPPNLYPAHRDYLSAWASLTADGSREWLQLGYAQPESIARIDVYETFHPGAIDSIYVRNALDGSLHLEYAAVPETLPPVARILTATFPRTPFPVDAVRLTLASDLIPNWNEIDAVLIAPDSVNFFLPGITAVGNDPDAGNALHAGPNPFRTAATVAFTLARDGPARLEVFDLRGARVATLAVGPFVAGRHSVAWRGIDDAGRRVVAGVYFVRLEADGVVRTRRVVRLE